LPHLTGQLRQEAVRGWVQAFAHLAHRPKLIMRGCTLSENTPHEPSHFLRLRHPQDLFGLF
jgi:hypothetical protein